MPSIADIRTEYKQRDLLESDASADPIDQFAAWWKEAVDSKIEEVNAMTLATASKTGVPAARIILLKGFSAKGFNFFTNYDSDKGQQLAENPHAALILFWKELERQVRITGTVEKLPAEDSDQYYGSRPSGSRIGAWASPQSQVISGREWLVEQEAKWTNEYQDRSIPRPPYWGGYRLKPAAIEFWQGRPSRLHDRLLYTLLENGNWKMERLAP